MPSAVKDAWGPNEVQVHPAPESGGDTTTETHEPETKSIAWAQLPGNVKTILERYDTNRDGTFSVEEVINISNDLIREKTEKKKYGRIIMVLACVMMLMLAANAALTAGIVFLAKDAEVDSSGKMKVKGTNLVISTAGNSAPAPLSSYLPDKAFDELKAFTATSDTGARVHVNVLGWMRIPAAECLPPIVKLNTQAGSIHIEGETLEFDDDLAPLFLEAGFLTGSHVTATGVGDTRRKLSMSALTGFFNQLDDVKALDPAACMPTLPTLPKSISTVSTTLDSCDDCEDEHGFTILNLGGVETMNGVLYQSIDEATTRIVGEDGKVKLHTVTRYPRFPELRFFDVSNGTHSLSWVDYQTKMFHCTYGTGFTVAKEDDPDQTDHIPSEVPQPPQRPIEEFEALGMIPTVRYDGFTWYTSRGRGGEPIATLKYEVDLPGPKIKLDLFTAVNDPQKFLGFQMRNWNEDTHRYEISQYADYHKVYTDDEIPASLSDPSRFELPDMMQCIPKNAEINQPPQPQVEPVGPGIITSPSGEDAWGGVRVNRPVGYELSEDMSDYEEAEEEEEGDEEEEELLSNSSHQRSLARHWRALEERELDEDEAHAEHAGNRRELGRKNLGARRRLAKRRRSGPVMHRRRESRRRCSDCEVQLNGGSSCTTVDITAGPIEINIDPCTPMITAVASGGYGPLDVSGEITVDGSKQPPDVSGCIKVSLGCSSVLGKVIKKSAAEKICDALQIPDLVVGEGCVSSTDESVAGCIDDTPIPFTEKGASVHFDLCISAEASYDIFIHNGGIRGEACIRYVEVYDYTNKAMGSFIRIDYSMRAWLSLPSVNKYKWGTIYPTEKKWSCSKKVWRIIKKCTTKVCDFQTQYLYKYLKGNIVDMNPNPTGRTYAGNLEHAQFDRRRRRTRAEREAAVMAAKGRARV